MKERFLTVGIGFVMLTGKMPSPDYLLQLLGVTWIRITNDRQKYVVRLPTVAALLILVTFLRMQIFSSCRTLAAENFL